MRLLQLLWPLALMSSVQAEWPQLRGPNFNGIAEEKLPMGVSGVTELWKVDLTDGFSSFSVGNGMIFTLVQREEEGIQTEVCIALDEKTGKEKWAASCGMARYDEGGSTGAKDNKGGDGPRTTPSFHDGFVYVTDANLVVHAFRAGDGALIWTRDILSEFGGQNIQWQNAASPLVEGGLLFTAGGGKGKGLIALHTKDGSTAWSVEDDEMTHATPVLTTIHGVRQIIFFTRTGLVSLQPADGKVLWRYDFPFRVSAAASPVIEGDVVYCSAGYGVGAGAARIEKRGDDWKAEPLFRAENRLFNHWSTPVARGSFLYGMFSFKQYGDGPVSCVNMRTGEVAWEQPGFGPGQLILIGERCVALSDAGVVVIFDAKAEGYTEIFRKDVLEGKCWSTPAYSDGKLYLRSTKAGVCLQVN